MRHTRFSDEVHVVAFDDQKIVGDLALQPNPDDQDVWWLMHVGVDADYRNQGVARRLLNDAAEFVRDRHRSKISPSSLTDDGEAYLTGILDEIGVRHPGLLTRWNPLQGTLVELYKTRSSDDNDPELSLVGGDDKVLLTKENYSSIMHDDLHVCVVHDAHRAEWMKGVVAQALKGVVASDMGNVACAQFMTGELPSGEWALAYEKQGLDTEMALHVSDDRDTVGQIQSPKPIMCSWDLTLDEVHEIKAGGMPEKGSQLTRSQ